MHTLYKNLLRYHMNIEATTIATNGVEKKEEIKERKILKRVAEHLHTLIVEVIDCFLSNIPTSLNKSTRDAMWWGKMSDIEKGGCWVQKKEAYGENWDGLLFLYKGQQSWVTKEIDVLMHARLHLWD